MNILLFLAGDVMTGRGIDQILSCPGDPTLHEEYVKNALTYVNLAEKMSGQILKPVSDAYIWGEALPLMEQFNTDLRIINLETSITTSNRWENKGINYRMNPDNIGCLTTAHIDCCVLANNHLLDWGKTGMMETLETLHRYGIKTAGAGKTLIEAEQPAILPILNKGRVLVFSLGDPSSGIPKSWAATENKLGVNFLNNVENTIHSLQEQINKIKQPNDVILVSIHWGSNWGYDINPEHRAFAHSLIDLAGVDIIHGHSSHHAKGIENYHQKLILYGCGDLINDYEGITSFESFHGDLRLLYFVTLESETGNLVSLKMATMKSKKFSLVTTPNSDPDLLRIRDILNREGKTLDSQFVLMEDGILDLVPTN